MKLAARGWMMKLGDRRRVGRLAAGLAALALAGAADDRSAALEQLRAQDGRVAAVALRLATANAELCDETGPQFGLVLHSARQYRPGLRAEARRALGATDGVSVEAAPSGSPAAEAGLRAGDVITAIGMTAIDDPQTPDDAIPASYASVEGAMAALVREGAAGGVRVAFRRGGQPMTTLVRPVRGCAYEMQLIPSKAIDASADGRRVFVTTGLAAYVTRDDDLALVLGHELAHDLLHHRRQLDARGVARKVLGDLGSSPSDLKRAEREADYVGAYLTARAGYDLSGADAFWRRFAKDHGDALLRWSHPRKIDRARALAEVRAEIEAKRAAGQPLLPDPTRLRKPRTPAG